VAGNASSAAAKPIGLGRNRIVGDSDRFIGDSDRSIAGSGHLMNGGGQLTSRCGHSFRGSDLLTVARDLLIAVSALVTAARNPLING
jgi:hypothetical protein